MERSAIMASARLAGEVLRYHTWPVHRRQSVGEHVWQQMRIYWQIFGPMRAAVSTYILWSDAGEFVTGDLPFPVKARNPVLKRETVRLEEAAVANMGGPAASRLTDVERLKVKVTDLLEMTEYGLAEVAMGNTYAQPIVDDTLLAVRVISDGLPKRDRARIAAYVQGLGVPSRESGA